MKTTIQGVLVAIAVATLGAGAVGTACAQSAPAAPASSAPQQTPHRGHFHRFGGSRVLGSLLRATRQLNLTPDQQTSIKGILTSARHAHQPGAQSQQPAMTVLGNPGDPGFASAVQGAQAAAAGRIQQESALAGQIYAVLNSTQRQQLPTVLASIQAKEQARRAAWAAKRASSGNG
jgi:Spy/CpxP family protein refolding chaperone